MVWCGCGGTDALSLSSGVTHRALRASVRSASRSHVFPPQLHAACGLPHACAFPAKPNLPIPSFGSIFTPLRSYHIIRCGIEGSSYPRFDSCWYSKSSVCAHHATRHRRPHSYPRDRPRAPSQASYSTRTCCRCRCHLAVCSREMINHRAWPLVQADLRSSKLQFSLPSIRYSTTVISRFPPPIECN